MLWEIGRKGGKYEISALAAFPEIVLKNLCTKSFESPMSDVRTHT